MNTENNRVNIAAQVKAGHVMQTLSNRHNWSLGQIICSVICDVRGMETLYNISDEELFNRLKARLGADIAADEPKTMNDAPATHSREEIAKVICPTLVHYANQKKETN